jgi:hypothetical protein
MIAGQINPLEEKQGGETTNTPGYHLAQRIKADRRPRNCCLRFELRRIAIFRTMIELPDTLSPTSIGLVAGLVILILGYLVFFHESHSLPLVNGKQRFEIRLIHAKRRFLFGARGLIRAGLDKVHTHPTPHCPSSYDPNYSRTNHVYHHPTTHLIP